MPVSLVFEITNVDKCTKLNCKVLPLYNFHNQITNNNAFKNVTPNFNEKLINLISLLLYYFRLKVSMSIQFTISPYPQVIYAIENNVFIIKLWNLWINLMVLYSIAVVKQYFFDFHPIFYKTKINTKSFWCQSEQIKFNVTQTVYKEIFHSTHCNSAVTVTKYPNVQYCLRNTLTQS